MSETGQDLRVYWQPGCTSCLKTREYLRIRGIAFVAVNVREEAGAMDELRALGARSVPVVARGNRFVHGQDLGELARFVGADYDAVRLSAAELVMRIVSILAAARRYIVQIPDPRLEDALPGRQRTNLDLAYHIFALVGGFLDAAAGGRLSAAHFEEKPPAGRRTAAHVVAYGILVGERLAGWWQEAQVAGLPASVATYYGRQPAHNVLERSCWHAAQHCRQLMAVLEDLGIAADGPLGDDVFGGLPLPESVWDDDVVLAVPAAARPE